MGPRLLSAVLAGLLALCAEGRLLKQQSGGNSSNPFLATLDSASPAPSSPPPASPPAPSGGPTAVIPAPSPGAEVSPSVCPCTTNGLSGGVNTSVVGCRQMDIVSGSNQFTVRGWAQHVGRRAGG